MNVLALDLSRHVGVAHDGPNGRAILSTKHLPVVEGDGINGFDFGTVGIAFRSWLRELIAVVKPDLVGFEAPLMPRGENFVTPEVTVRLLMGLAWDTETTARECGVELTDERNVATVKKFWAGHGFAKKPDMMARCRQLGYAPRNDNEGDACALWHLLKAEHCGAEFQFVSTPIGGRRHA